MTRGLAAALAVFCWLAVTPGARAWEPLRSENKDVERGNRLMSEAKYGEALMSYDTAAAELPESKGVQLNRGLALLAQDSTEQAKEAFVAAADPAAPKEVRGDAYYDLGVAFAREGDALAAKDEYEPAMANYREAVDAFKRSLRVQPGNRDAAWNLEYALQRIREQEEKQQDQQQQDQQQQDQQQQDQQQQDQQQQDQQQQDQQQQDQQQQDQQQQDQEQQDQQQQDQQQQDQQQKDQQQKQDQQQQDQRQDQQQRDQQQQPSSASEAETEKQEEVRRFLDALEQNEESLPVERARRQSAGRRRPEKDW
ncbi:MAG: hypothetical protein AAF436_01760 [Myxococcota bacterium]